MTDKKDKVPLSELCEAIVDCEHKTASTQPWGIPSIRTTNIKNGRLDLENANRVSEETYKKWTVRLEPKPGDLILAREAPVGEVGIIPPGQRVCLGQRTVLIRTNKHKLHSRYLLYLLLTPKMRHEMVSHSEGSTVSHINMSDIRNLKIPHLPPLPEQKAIAHILGTLDDKIELNREMNQTLEAMARAIFKSWFVDFDPVRAKMEGRQPAGMDAATAELFPDEFEESALGMIPRGWRVVQIGDIAARVAMGPFGSRITTDNFVNSGVPVIRGNNLVDGFNENRFVYLTNEKANELRSANAFSEDIVFTHRGTLGQVGFIPKSADHPRYIVSQSQMLLSVDKSQVSPKFIYRFFRFPFGQQALLANTNTTGVPSIARPSTSLKAIQLVIPPKFLSDRFDEVANPIDSKQELNNLESHTLASIRDTLLPKLLSGEIRFFDAEKIAAKAM